MRCSRMCVVRGACRVNFSCTNVTHGGKGLHALTEPRMKKGHCIQVFFFLFFSLSDVTRARRSLKSVQKYTCPMLLTGRRSGVGVRCGLLVMVTPDTGTRWSRFVLFLVREQAINILRRFVRATRARSMPPLGKKVISFRGCPFFRSGCRTLHFEDDR
ncbi:hypothetical protein B0T19DRAFT_246165 [Cercophora scortea]|uniref:Uncharacterized protein n=1 Tax=Cercophora scortea TaxID=314031 RepID=A0AAE0M642_9PEZI|nr:hypothetical protein B0T19DRAFT_246165 [Cercophora scortea]